MHAQNQSRWWITEKVPCVTYRRELFTFSEFSKTSDQSLVIFQSGWQVWTNVPRHVINQRNPTVSLLNPLPPHPLWFPRNNNFQLMTFFVSGMLPPHHWTPIKTPEIAAGFITAYLLIEKAQILHSQCMSPWLRHTEIPSRSRYRQPLSTQLWESSSLLPG